MAFSPNAGKLDAYRSTAVHSGVDAADPHRLVVMLMDGALERIAAASGLMKHGGGAEKAQLLHRAVAIIDELRNGLNFKAGGAIATNLDALYEYMCQRLMQANAQNKPEWLDEVSRLLGEIRSAWLQTAAGKRRRRAMSVPASQARRPSASAAGAKLARAGGARRTGQRLAPRRGRHSRQHLDVTRHLREQRWGRVHEEMSERRELLGLMRSMLLDAYGRACFRSLDEAALESERAIAAMMGKSR